MKKLFAVVLVAVLAAFVVGCSSESGTADVSSDEVAYTVRANKMTAEFKANEVKADEKYKGKVVIVNGKVTDMGKDITDEPYIIVGGTGMLDGVQCMFAGSGVDAISKLSKGDSVSVKGKYDGFLMYPLLANSSLQ